ncbi:MAG: type II secretion system protein [Gemmatimonadota bacterium]|jgi:prepilin-type N-terminal cleavage/methylation domain-containing protein
MSRRRGFTLLEVVIALLIGSILTSIALSGFGNARGRYAVRGARSTFASLLARTRAQAIEAGGRMILFVDVAGDSAFIWNGQNLETIRFDEELKVDLASEQGSFRICMNARGFADTGCNSFWSETRLYFRHNADTASVRILPLGQLVY